ncbi:MAG: imidazoleglycerol-phosphate dehydratase HisB [Oscillospiraceae bacterium]|nr:imidazoleglycerol-phosphate dehydratase HisB [Oscillospiraceae bacterium]
MRQSKITRKTKETDISAVLNIDGGGNYSIETGVGFLDHMLELFARHSGIDLELKCKGDIHIDGHHSAEDIGIVLGKAFAEAAGDGRGIERYASVMLPMDETLVMAATDICGRSSLCFNAPMPSAKAGDLDTELVKEFFSAFIGNFPIALHIKLMYGDNTHHIIEAIFKAAAVTLKKALTVSGDRIPSTKGTIV